tara:strand:+ start:913 stop:1512 length:600 start_codon:yes stop_codon:yes gene_type:complete
MDPSKFLYHPMRLLDHREMEYRFCMQNIQFDNGLFLEFGVYNGSSINILSKLRPNKIFHGFDTFTGLPEDWDLGNKKIKAGHFYLEKMPSVEKNVILHKGLFEDTIPKWKKQYREKISFINIDCDLYSSTKTVLEHLNSQIVKDTIIRFDDLLPSPIRPYPKWLEGEWKALSEWVGKFKREIVPLSRSWKQGCTILVIK